MRDLDLTPELEDADIHRISISSTSEEVRDVITTIVVFIRHQCQVSISSTSEEVRDPKIIPDGKDLLIPSFH